MAASGAQAFLSRLCGGEEVFKRGWQIIRFLSRLCGGEATELLVPFDFSFLSRLCVGEEWLGV